MASITHTATRTAKSSIKSLLNFSSQTYRGITSSIRLLPDFIIIGGQRCGTTSLYYYLMEHPYIARPHTKEVHFFDDHFTKGLSWYRAQFPTLVHRYYSEQICKQRLLTGEASPYYLFHPHTPRRIAAQLPQVKLIALLRNPIDRAYSQHWLEMKGGYEKLSFKEAIEQEEGRIAGELEKMLADENYHSYTYRRCTYLTRGIYADQLQRWYQYYPKEQILLIKSEDLYTKPTEVMQQTLAFLDLPYQQDALYKEYKQYRLPMKRGYKVQDKTPPMDPAIHATLVDYFRPHNARLAALVGRDFEWDK